MQQLTPAICMYN